VRANPTSTSDFLSRQGPSRVLLAGAALVLILAGGCASGGGTAAQPSAEPAAAGYNEPARESGPLEVDLRPVGDSGVSGTVGFVPQEGGVRVELSLRGLPKPEGVYVGTIYRGSCAEELGGTGGGAGRYFASRSASPREAAYRFVHDDHGASPADEERVVQTLTSVASGPEGTGASTTPLPVSTDELLSGEPKYVDVHGEDSRPLACVDLPVRGSSGA